MSAICEISMTSLMTDSLKWSPASRNNFNPASPMP